MIETNKRRNLLDTPFFSFIVVNWETVLFVLILVAAAAMRFIGLSLRSLSHDGSIHASWSYDLYAGRGYRHNPTYHGPFLYHFTALLFFLFGDSDTTALSSVAIFGVILVALPWLLRRELGRIGTLLAAAVLAVSPFAVAYSRILRHDMFLAVWGLLLVVAVFRYLRERADKWLYLAAAATALTMTTKEVAFIEVFIVGTFLFFLLLSKFFPTLQEYLRGRSVIELIFLWWLLVLWKILVTFWEYLRNGTRSRPRPASFDLVVVVGTLVAPMALAPLVVKALGYDPSAYTDSKNAIPSLVVFGVVAGLTALIGLLWDWRRWLASAGIFYVITLLLFTTFLTNGNGVVSGYVSSLGYWLSQQEVKRGGQPWFYYFIIMPLYEFMPLALGGLGALALFGGWSVPRSNGEAGEKVPPKSLNINAAFVGFLLYWALAITAILSWAGEKMPWLIVHLTIPWTLLGAWFAGRVLEGVDWRAWWQRSGGVVLALIPVAFLGLVTLLRFRPFGGLTLSDQAQTMRWIGAALILVISGAGLFLAGRRLGLSALGKSVFIALLVALYALTVRFSITATHININYATEWIGYAHSTPDPVRVIHEIEDLSRRYAGDLSMPVAYDDDSSWPFAWYFRRFTNANFYGKKPNKPFDQPVVLVGSANESEVKPYLGDDYYRFEERLIWWPLEVYKDFTWQNLKRKLPAEEQPPPPPEGEAEKVPILTYLRLLVSEIREQRQDPAKRQTLWNVIWHRKFQESTAQWPLVHRFALYVRKDVANQLWDLGVGPVPAEALPDESYTDLYTTLTAVNTWGTPGNGDGQFNNPRGLTVDWQGFVYVADSGNHRIQKFDLEGNYLLSWGGQGNAPGQFQEPWGLAVDKEGRVYVADLWNHRIQVFDGEGNLLNQWGAHAQVQGLEPDTASLFWGPRDVAIGDEGQVLITDTGNKRVQVFSSDGKFITMFGGFGLETGQMNEPVGIAVGPDGRIYVADAWNRRVQVFDASFIFVRSWPVDGWWGESVVNKPYLAVDDVGRVYVTDPEGYQVLIFNAEGQPLNVFGQIGSDASSFNLPTGIDVDEEGYIYVADADNHRVMKFAPLPETVD